MGYPQTLLESLQSHTFPTAKNKWHEMGRDDRRTKEQEQTNSHLMLVKLAVHGYHFDLLASWKDVRFFFQPTQGSINQIVVIGPDRFYASADYLVGAKCKLRVSLDMTKGENFTS